MDYPVRLEMVHALLNLVYAQLVLKQWRSAFEAYEEAMLLYAADLRERETPLGRVERGAGQYVARTGQRQGAGDGAVWGRWPVTTTGSIAPAGTALGEYKGREGFDGPVEFNSGNSTTWLALQ